MRDNSNKKLIIITLLIMLCLASFYGVIKYYSDKDIEVRLVDKEGMADIIESPFDDYNLGDTVNYASKWSGTEGCLTKSSSGCRCPSSSDPNTWKAARECIAQCNKCGSCRTSAENVNYVCHTCNTAAGYKKDKNGNCTSPQNPLCKFFEFSVVTEHTDKPGTVSETDKISISYRTSNYCPPGYKASISVQNGTPVSQEGVDHFFTATTYGKCPEVTISISLNGKTQIKKLKVRGDWNNPVTVPEVTKPECTTRECSEQDESPSHNRYYEQDSEKKYTIMHTRGCSSGHSSEKPACYGDASVLSLATSVKWIKPSQKDSVNRIEIKGITKKEDCVLFKEKNSLNYCEPKNITAIPQTKTASTCEGNIEIKTTDGLSCDKNPFYTIKCDNTITTKFDNGDDGNKITTTNEIYVGQGFKYGITVNTKRKCEARFYVDNWKKAYEYNQNWINQLNADLKKTSKSSEKKEINSLIKTYEKKINDLKNMVKTYRNYNVTKGYDEATALSIDYKISNKPSNVTSNFETVVIKEVNGKKSNEKKVKLNISGVTDPYDYDWNSEREIKLIPAKVYINKDTGKPDSSGIDGGNKVYVDYYIDKGTYTMNIKVSNVGGNNTINNNKCKLKIKDQELLYRPIDLSNPFISEKWTPGSNWVNDLFDFSKIIDSDIWKN